jgi:hypothetical protein
MSDHKEHGSSQSMTYLYIALGIVGLIIISVIHGALA